MKNVAEQSVEKNVRLWEKERMAAAELAGEVTKAYVLNEAFYWFNIFLPWINSPSGAKASSLSRIHDNTQTHHTR